MAITVHSLINQVEEELCRMENNAPTANSYRTPEFPMLVVYLGEDSISGHKDISENLFRMWPAFRNELQFIGLKKTASDFECESLDSNNSIGSAPLKYDDISGYVRQLFNKTTHFNKFDSFIVYYILDTSSIGGGEEFQSWLSIINRFIEAMDVDMNMVNSLLCVLLEGGITHEKEYKEIRSVLAKMTDGSMPDCPAVNTMVAGKYLSNGTLLPDWSDVYHIVASTIALSNDHSVDSRRPFFSYPVITPYYARVCKTVDQMSQIIVDEFLEFLSEKIKIGSTYSLANIDDLNNRLGITQQGSVSMVEKLVEREVEAYYPTYDQLVMFPVKDWENPVDFNGVTKEQFDELTMGGWSAFLTSLKSRISNSLMESGLKRQYAKQLETKFSTKELSCFADNLTELKHIFHNSSRKLDCSDDFFARSKKEMVSSISTSETVLEQLIQAVTETSARAKAMERTWQAIFDSKNEIHHSKDAVLKAFYHQRLVEYFDKHGQEIITVFRNCQSEGELQQCFDEQLVHYLHHDPVFHLSFAKSLAMILAANGLPLTPAQYIQEKIVNSTTYFHALSQIDQSAGSAAIIMDIDEKELYKELKQILPSSVFYYDTNMVGSIEYIQMFKLEHGHF